jgi:hypothetical protein
MLAPGSGHFTARDRPGRAAGLVTLPGQFVVAAPPFWTTSATGVIGSGVWKLMWPSAGSRATTAIASMRKLEG